MTKEVLQGIVLQAWHNFPLNFVTFFQAETFKLNKFGWGMSKLFESPGESLERYWCFFPCIDHSLYSDKSHILKEYSHM